MAKLRKEKLTKSCYKTTDFNMAVALCAKHYDLRGVEGTGKKDKHEEEILIFMFDNIDKLLHDIWEIENNMALVEPNKLLNQARKIRNIINNYRNNENYS